MYCQVITDVSFHQDTVLVNWFFIGFIPKLRQQGNLHRHANVAAGVSLEEVDPRDLCLMYLHLPLKKNNQMYVNTWDLEPHGPFIRGWLSIFGWFWNSLLNRECLDFTIPIHFKKVGFRYQDLDEFLDGVSLMWSWYTCPKDPLWPYNWSEWTCFFTVWGSGIPDVRHCFPALNWDAENKDSQMLNVIMQSIFTYMWVVLGG